MHQVHVLHYTNNFLRWIVKPTLNASTRADNVYYLMGCIHVGLEEPDVVGHPRQAPDSRGEEGVPGALGTLVGGIKGRCRFGPCPPLK